MAGHSLSRNRRFFRKPYVPAIHAKTVVNNSKNVAEAFREWPGQAQL